MDSSSQKQSSPFVLGNCLSCDGLVRVPAHAKANSKVRCPHCSESYSLAQILDESIPELELLVEPGGPQNSPQVDEGFIVEENGQKAREVFVVPAQLKKGAHSGRRRSRSSDSRGDSDERSRGSSSRSRRSSDQHESFASRSTSRLTSGLAKRRLSKKKSPTVEMAKIVFGGLLAVPIAYLMVFWIFSQDPLGVGPGLHNVAPFLVPDSLSGEKIPKTSSPTKGDEEANDDGSLAVPDRDPDDVRKDIDK